MKTIRKTVYATCTLALLTGCAGSRLSNSNALADDVYYSGSSQPATATAQRVDVPVTESDVTSYDARVASYSSTHTYGSDSRDFSQVQQYYANAGLGSQSADSTSYAPASDSNKTLIVEGSDVDVKEADGYWVDGFWGSEADQSYAERLIRFQRPNLTINYYSPLMTSARYSGDWNIYIDNAGGTYFVPTWSNPLYTDYYYGSLAWDWGWNWGWRHRYYGGFWGSWDPYWGWGWGFDLAWGYPFYCSYWWHDHYFHHGWYGHHHGPHHGPNHAIGFGPDNDRNRPQVVHASRASQAPQSYSAQGRERNMTVNPNSQRAAQRYQTAEAASRSQRSYTRQVDGSATRSDGAQATQFATNSRRTQSSNGVSSNTRQGSSLQSVQSSGRVSTNNSSRSAYTPSSSNNTRSSTATKSSTTSRQSSLYNNGTRRSASSSYSPSTSSSSYTQGASRRSSSSVSGSSSRSTRSYSGTGSSSSRSGSFSGGSSVRSSSRSSGSFSGGASRSGGVSRSSGGGGRSR